MPIIGLDIGEHSFRAVELDKTNNGIVINNFGHFENPQLDRSKIAINKDIYINALKNFFSEFNFSTSNVVLGINDSNVFMRVVNMPNMSDSDLEKTITYEAEKYVPLPIDQVNITYQKVQSISNDSENISVQIIAAKTSQLKEYVDIVKKANLVPVAIEPETIAISRALLDKNDSSGTIIVDIGHSNSVVIVNYNNTVHFTRSIPFGGDHITRALKEKLDIEYYQAEEYKKTYGIDKSYFDGKIHDIIKPVIESIILEVKRALMFFSKQNSSVVIKKAIITGGSSQLPGLLTYLVNTLDIEVILGYPLKKMTISPKIEKRSSIIFDNINIYSTSIGLAMKGL